MNSPDAPLYFLYGFLGAATVGVVVALVIRFLA